MLKHLSLKERYDAIDYADYYALYKRTFIKGLIIIGLPFYALYIINDFLTANYLVGSISFTTFLLLCILLYRIIRKGVSARADIYEEIFVRFFLTLFIIYLFYAVGLERNISKTPWLLIFPMLAFVFASSIKEAMVWISIVAVIILYSFYSLDFGSSSTAILEIKTRILIVFSILTISGLVISLIVGSAVQNVFDHQKEVKETNRRLNQEIEERKQAEGALRSSEEKYRILNEASPIGISLIDQEGHYKYLNPKFTEIFGYTAEDVPTGRKWFRRAYPDKEYRHQVISTWLEDQKKYGVGEARSRTYTVACHNGEKKTIHFKPVIMENEDQLIIYEDETEKLHLEKQLRHAQKMESVGRLAGGVAHDFNNMLGVILGHAELGLSLVDPSLPVHGDLKEIEKAGRRSANLTRQLLAFARRQPAIPKLLDLNDTISGMLKMLRRLIGEDIDLSWIPDKKLWTVKIDPVQVDQILANLCVNARDAIKGVGKITIGTENVEIDEIYAAQHPEIKPGQYARLAVSDNGTGFDKETAENLFEPFFTTKEFGEGTGLGLSTVYGIVKQNNGFINVYSEPGYGSTFKIYLPGTQETVKVKESADAKPIAKGNETVLLVEDEESMLALSKAVLTRFGYSVLEARTPLDAIEIVKQHEDTIHLLITDVVLPEMNGKDLKEHIKKLIPDLKVLFMSGYTADIIMHQGILEDDVNFIQKPFSVKNFAGKVREVLDGA